MNRGDARHKLEEAEFFLGHLKPNYGKEKKFDFYLGAFLGAARAVTWIMVAEYDKVEGWRSWYDARQVDVEEEKLLKGTGDARNRLLKSEPLRTLGEIILSGPYTATGDEQQATKFMDRIVRERVPIKIGGTSGKYSLEAIVDEKPVKLYFRQAIFERALKEFPDENILDLCQRYYQWLAKLVEECEEKFGR